MAQKRQTPLTKEEKISLSLKAQHRERLTALAIEADKNLQLKPTETWRTLTEEHKEIVLYRCYGGDTVKQVCEELGISPGLINMAAYHDPEGFGTLLSKAREHGAHTQADMLIEIPFRDDMTDASKKMLMDGIKYLASKRNRSGYGEHSSVDHNVTVQPVAMPDWSFGQVIDVKPIEDKTDPDDGEFEG